MRRHYFGEVRYVDEYVGKTIQALKDLGLYDSSLLKFTSDHGEEFWDDGGLSHGRVLYAEPQGATASTKRASVSAFTN